MATIFSSFKKTVPTFTRSKSFNAVEKLSEQEQKFLDVCSLSPDKALEALSSSEHGLSSAQAEEHLITWGENDLGKKKHQGFLKEILIRCKNPLVIQLLVICVASILMGDPQSATIVGFMVILSVGFSYCQEHRSSKAVEKLRAMVQTNCHVLRDGKEVEIPMSQIVPGDIVSLQAGSLIPADIRLISSKDFFVSQSSLTGESMPVEKFADAGSPTDNKKRTIIELPNAVFQGSNVESGSAKGLVVNTGINTHFGAIAQKLAGAPVLTSFDRGIAGFTWLMIRFMVVMVSIVFLIVGIKDHSWGEALLFGLSVAVGLTPEMLPMIVVVNLSKGAIAMSRKKVIVKRLNAIQNFGAINILCTDKTGTLTQDRVFLEKHVDVTNRPSEDVLRYAYMNSYYQTGLRNLLDASVLSHTDLDVDRGCRKVDEIPFDFQRKRMSVVVDYEGDHVLVCKGAVEDIYKACTHYQVDDEVYMMIDLIKNDLLEEYEKLSCDGYRVLGIAYREFPRDKTTFSIADESELILLGYIAFLDPPKESALKAIASLKTYGVETKILTGDNALVTRKICKDVGIDTNEVVTGDQLLSLTEQEIGDFAEKHNVFARLSPAQKERLIVALQERGHVVGYMGDGINDALSMRVADVGISVDTAVDIAKESADIILLEKSLMVLEDGIIEGRKVFGNIIKYIRMGASSNFGNMFSVLGGACFLPFLPMAPIQVLVNNLLYDISQIGIPSDHVDTEYLQKPRQWNIGNIGRYMIFIGPLSSIFDYTTFFLMLYFFHCHLFSNAGTSPEMKTYYEKLFHTGWFVESILTQTLIVHIIRTAKIPFFQSIASPFLLAMTFLIMIVGGVIPYTPLGSYFEMVPLPGIYWSWVAGFLLCYATITHKVNVWCMKRFGID
ncbi:MAG: magnesium-translocating P-type ATPase [Verrucomicrobia bacterium]|nr:magnesium-translocating P-type ATPase [Verrucomicrobiota bacterium]